MNYCYRLVILYLYLVSDNANGHNNEQTCSESDQTCATKESQSEERMSSDDDTMRQSPSSDCLDFHEKCAIWASMGECEKNQSYMEVFCANSCQTCPPSCLNQDTHCAEWAQRGECDKNPSYMHVYCKKSCDVCPCQDHRDECAIWAGQEECHNNPSFMHLFCAKSCEQCQNYRFFQSDWGVPQVAAGAHTPNVYQILFETNQYMNNAVQVQDRYEMVRDHCRNQDELCSIYALARYCETNSTYMNHYCAPACQSCDYLEFFLRCPIDPTVHPIWEPGDVNKMFQRITSTTSDHPTFQQHYHASILSQPLEVTASSQQQQQQRRRPWVVLLENFLTPSECQKLIELGTRTGYFHSVMQGPQQPDGSFEEVLNTARTSMQVWCTENCHDDPVVVQIRQKLHHLTGIPDENSEHLQLLRYQVGQKYLTHHDYGIEEVFQPIGARILTVFFYLNTVPAGGETNFPALNITVTPKQGSVLIWSNVLNEDPNQEDPQTIHQALPVQEGIKYGANAWYHQRDFKSAWRKNCH